MSLSKYEFELFLNFAAKHSRFLKLRETSFNSKQILDGVKLCEKAVKSIVSICKSTGLPFSECLGNPSKKAKIIRELRKKVSRLTPYQATFIVDHFASFQSAVSLSKEPVTHKSAKQASEYGDKYYQPVQHKYR